MGFYVGANYIFGLPDDNFDSMKETLDLSLRVNSEWSNFYSGMAYPGSQLYPMAKIKNGCYQMMKMVQVGLDTPNILMKTLPLRTEHIKGSEVLQFRDNAFDAYFNNKIIFQWLKKLLENKQFPYQKNVLP